MGLLYLLFALSSEDVNYYIVLNQTTDPELFGTFCTVQYIIVIGLNPLDELFASATA
jgi:hypothetical protein